MSVYQMFLTSLFLIHHRLIPSQQKKLVFAIAEGHLYFKIITQYFDFHCTLAESYIKYIP